MGTLLSTLGLVAVLLVLATVLILRRSRVARRTMAAAVVDATVLRGPENANYQGSTSDEYPKVLGNGVIVLTAEHLVVHKLDGGTVEVPLSEVRGARADDRFRGRSHRNVLVLETTRGEVGYHVIDPPAWVEAVQRAAPRRA